MEKIRCKQCGYQWLPRTAKPIKCPHCQSRKWDKRKHKRLHGQRRIQFEVLCAEYNWRCLVCGRLQNYLSADHIDPYGLDDISNIQPLCGSCNASKGSKVLDYRSSPHPYCAIPYQRPVPVNYSPPRLPANGEYVFR
jgi:5-methylcytosine-specific restriction endonuclease McrA